MVADPTQGAVSSSGDDPKSPKRARRMRRSVRDGLTRWHTARGDDLVDKVPKDPQVYHDGPGSDDRLRFIDELLESPLGQAWLPDLRPGEGAEEIKVDPTAPGIVAPLPRRKIIAGKKSDPANKSSPSMARTIGFNASNLQALARLFVWLSGVLRFASGTLLDLLRGRDTVQRRAARLRHLFERSGPTFVKLGQQLSLRADLLPYAYCEELSKMLDSVPPFPTEQAITIIERRTGRKISEIFAIFDPQPIGSASLSCVFQAVLNTGEKVAVKVRRPGVGEMLVADIKALDWLMAMAELFTFVREGMTRNLRTELRDMLLEELDFNREARNTEIFRTRARDMNQQWVTAPRVFFDLVSEEVLVTEFVSGVFMWEIISALDHNNTELIEQIRARGIDPRILAERLLEIFNWETLEGLLFHADPHSANIIVRPGNTVAFIDFGSCGHFPARNRRIWQQLHYHLENEDLSGVVQATISLMEPLPPIDLHRFTKEVEGHYRDWLYALKSDHSEWWERSSGVLWLRLVSVAQRYSVPFSLDTLRLFRTIFAADAIMYRLWARLDREEEFRKYRLNAGLRAKKRVLKAVRKRVRDGLQPDDYLRIEELWRMSNQIDQWIQHRLDTPTHRFADALSKAAFGVTVLLRVVTVAFALHVVGLVAAVAWQVFVDGQPMDVGKAFREIVSGAPYQFSLAAVILVLIRRMRMRFEDVDV